MATRPYHHGSLREALLARAEATVSERGLEALSLRELARDLGVSHAAPRRHFAGRQELLDALAESGFGRLGEEVAAAIAAAGDRFADRFAAAAAAYVRFATDHDALLALMFASKHRPDAEVLRDAADRAFAPLLDLVHEGQASGELEAGETERVGIFLLCSLQGLAAMVNAGLLPAGAREELLDEVSLRALRGARPS